MIKILYFMDSIASAGGIQEQVYNWIKGIDHDKFCIDIIGYRQLDYNGNPMNNEKDYISRVEQFGTKVYIFQPLKKGYIIKCKKDIDDFFREHHDYDIVHVHGSSKANYILAVAKKYNIKTRIIHSHNIRFQTNNKLKIIVGNILKKQTLTLATDFFACTKDAGVWLFGKKIVNSGKCKVVHNALDINRYKYDPSIRNELRKELKIKDDEIVFMNVGRFHRQKNHIFLAKVLEALSDRKIKYKMVFVGDAVRGNTQWKDEIIEKLKELDVYKDCIFLGVRNDVNRLLQAADFFVFPSLYEGLGIVCIEAQCSGLMCLVSNTLPNEVKSSDLVHFLPINNEQSDYMEWVNCIIENIGYKRYSPIEDISSFGYSIDENCRYLEDLYLECIENNGGNNN